MIDNKLLTKEKGQNIYYHYTNLDTLLKIFDGIKDKDFIFHASSIFHMNDTSEMKYGIRKLWEILPDIEEELHIPKEMRLSIIKNFDSTISLNKFINNLLRDMHNNFKSAFVISFSKDRDSLPMWNMYGNNGKGVSLGFDLHNFTNKFIFEVFDMTCLDECPKTQMLIKDIAYDKFQQSDYIVNFVKNIYKSFLQHSKENLNSSEFGNLLIRIYIRIIEVAAASIKSKIFAFENETRILAYAQNCQNILFKTGKHEGIIPYIQKSIPIDFMKTIILGPCCQANQIKSILEFRLRQIGMENKVNIVKSKIPFRHT